ncbi:acetyl esterase [Amorphus suaedae]
MSETSQAGQGGLFENLTDEDRATLHDIRSGWNSGVDARRAKVMRIYAPLAAARPKDGMRIHRDLSYGDDDRQILDVFAPEGVRGAPVLVYVHGGAFVLGNKSADGVIYDNVLAWFARQGFVGVNVEYRLAPAAGFPGGAFDTGLAVRWIAENIAEYGGDPDRIVVMGHSAGGTHVASYLLDPDVGIDVAAGVKAAVLVSARLKADMDPENPMRENVAAYFGDDPEFLAAHSPTTLARNARWPMLVAFGGCENRYLDLYGLEFASRVGAATGVAPRVVQLPEHNHFSIVAHFDTGEEVLGREILRFLEWEAGIAAPARERA